MSNTERLTNAEKYCLARSWRLRRCRGYTRYLVRNALEYLPPKPPHVADPAEWRESLRVNLTAKIRLDYRNPVIIFMLLHIVLPIVIRLVIEWWLNRHQAISIPGVVTRAQVDRFMDECDKKLKKACNCKKP